jgi:hypothetical protein
MKLQLQGQIKMAARKTNTVQNVSVLKVLLNAIAVMPKSQVQIQELTGLCNSTVSRWLRFLNLSTKEQKNLVYIEDWKSGARGNPTALWKLGYGMPNAPRPRPKTASEYSRTWRKKQARTARIIETSTGVRHVSE